MSPPPGVDWLTYMCGEGVCFQDRAQCVRNPQRPQLRGISFVAFRKPWEGIEWVCVYVCMQEGMSGCGQMSG